MSMPDFKTIWTKMNDRIQKASRERRLNAIKTYYNVAEPVKYDDMTKERRDKIENCSDVEIEKFCTTLCKEAVNRDFISWITTGKTGDVGRTVYASLI